MKPLSERDENDYGFPCIDNIPLVVGMKPLSERDENFVIFNPSFVLCPSRVGMKPLSERDENTWSPCYYFLLPGL